MRHRDITVPDPEYKRFASAIRTVRQRAGSRSTHPVARVRAGCCHRAERAGGLLRVATPGHGRRHVPDVSVARPSFEEFPAMLQIPIILIYHPASTQPDWPRHVRLSLQSRHRSGTRRSGHRVRFRAGDGNIRFVRGAGRQPIRCGARMRYVPGIRTGPRRAGGDTTKHGRAARLRGGFTRTRSPAGRAVQSLVPARCSSQRRSRGVSGRLTQTSRLAVERCSEHPRLLDLSRPDPPLSCPWRPACVR